MSFEDTYDLVVLGGGSAGETAAGRVAAAGRRVALVESRLVGGECPYWGCIPSKALLIAASRRRQAQAAVQLGAVVHPMDVGDPLQAWHQAVRIRDDRAKHLDDSEAVQELTKQGVEIVRGRGSITGSAVSVEGRDLHYRNLLISVGASPVLPPIEGLKDVDPWTSDDALTSSELPESLVILGGGAIGVELAQVYSTFGTEVTIVEGVDRLLAMEEPEISHGVREVLAETAVRVVLGADVRRVSRADQVTTLHLADGSSVSAARLMVATGRKPRLAELGLESIDIDPKAGLAVGEDGRIAGHDNVYAAGDVTGQFPFTHTANYAGRVIAANVLGGRHRMNLNAVPRAVFVDPPVAGVGRTAEQAEKDGVHVVRATMDIGTTARGWLENEQGTLVLTADADRGTILGASAIGMRSDDWISQITLAIRAQVPLSVLVDTIQPFPAASEALFPAYEDLHRQARVVAAKSG
ncbi:MAG: dihydrolipoyl dehydrogenase family protein [Actinomycetes bacterium]